MPFNIKVGGAWKAGTGAKVKVGGAWKTVESIQVKVGGAWKVAFTNSISPAITATVSPNPSSFSQDVTISGFVLPVPTGGTVLVRDSGDNPVGTQANVNTSTGAYSITIPDQGIGTYTFSVNYSGFDLYQPDSTNVTVNVGTIPTTTTITRSASTYVYNATRVTLSGTVSPTPNGGYVTITSPGTGSIGAFSVNTLTGAYSAVVPVKDVGSYTNITATFTGYGNFAVATSGTTSYSVTQASTTLATTRSSASVQVGSSLTLTGTLSAGGNSLLSGRSITFQGLNSSSVWVNLGTGTTNGSGVATFVWTAVNGYTQARSVYAGETNYSGQTSAGVTFTVFNEIATATSITRSAASYTYNETPVTISGFVSPVPSGGTVTIRATELVGLTQFTNVFATVNVNTSTGAYSAVMPVKNAQSIGGVYATYDGSGVYLSSSSGTTSYTINKASTTITAPGAATVNSGTEITSTINLKTGTTNFANQSITFESSTNGSTWTSLGTGDTNASGNASLTWTPAAGVIAVRAKYAGATNYDAATSTSGAITVRTLKSGTYTPANVNFSDPSNWEWRGCNVNSPEQVASTFTMPSPAGAVDMKVTAMTVKAAGFSGENGSIRLCIWENGGPLVVAGGYERPASRTGGSFGSGSGIVSTNLTNTAVTPGGAYMAGFWREDNNCAYTTQWAEDAASGTTTYYDTTEGSPGGFNKNTTYGSLSLLFTVTYSYYS